MFGVFVTSQFTASKHYRMQINLYSGSSTRGVVTEEGLASSFHAEILFGLSVNLTKLFPDVLLARTTADMVGLLYPIQSNPIFIVKTQLTERSGITDKHRENHIKKHHLYFQHLRFSRPLADIVHFTNLLTCLQCWLGLSS